jgi:hypothetical protein
MAEAIEELADFLRVRQSLLETRQRRRGLSPVPDALVARG